MSIQLIYLPLKILTKWMISCINRFDTLGFNFILYVLGLLVFSSVRERCNVASRRPSFKICILCYKIVCLNIIINVYLMLKVGRKWKTIIEKTNSLNVPVTIE